MAGGGGGGGGGGRGGGTGAISGLARQVVLSPVAGGVKVSWHRSAIHVKPNEGWKPNRVYHLELLPGIIDLRRNATKRTKMIVFSTGPAVPTATIAGTALLWVEQRPLGQAVIRAAPLPDTVAYVTVADSAGYFRLSDVPPRRYLAQAAANALRGSAVRTAKVERAGRRGAAAASAAAQRAPADPGAAAPGRPAAPRETAARVDTSRVRKLLKQRPVPSVRLVVQTARPLAPGGKYFVRIRGATNLSGVAADAQGVLVVPVARDTTKGAGGARKPP